MIIAQCINDHSSSKKALECRKEIDFSIPVTGFPVHSNANMEMLLIRALAVIFYRKRKYNV